MGVGEEGEELGVGLGAEQRRRLQRWQGVAGAAALVEVETPVLLVETPLSLFTA